MAFDIRDRQTLLAVSPAALSAYARGSGWHRDEPYRAHSDVYVGESRPEIIVPRTERLGDYASVVATLIETFARVAEQDESSVYRALVMADRDVIHLRVAESGDGSVALEDGVSLVRGARSLVMAAAFSLREPQPVYQPRSNPDALDLVNRMRLGQTDQGSFVVTLLTPVVPPAIPVPFLAADDNDAPIARRATKRLLEALIEVRAATEQSATADEGAFEGAWFRGVSANLCEALARMVERFPTLDVGVTWARTRPEATNGRVVRFGQADAPVLREAARSFRRRAPRPDVRLHGFVRLLKRSESQYGGTVELATDVDGRQQSVSTALEQADYEQAVQAHKDRSLVVLTGDLDPLGRRLLNAHVQLVVRHDSSIGDIRNSDAPR